jgi:hypothetical protein
MVAAAANALPNGTGAANVWGATAPSAPNVGGGNGCSCVEGVTVTAAAGVGGKAGERIVAARDAASTATVVAVVAAVAAVAVAAEIPADAAEGVDGTAGVVPSLADAADSDKRKLTHKSARFCSPARAAAIKASSAGGGAGGWAAMYLRDAHADRREWKCTHARAFTHAYMHTHTYMHTCTHERTHTYINTCIQLRHNLNHNHWQCIHTHIQSMNRVHSDRHREKIRASSAWIGSHGPPHRLPSALTRMQPMRPRTIGHPGWIQIWADNQQSSPPWTVSFSQSRLSPPCLSLPPRTCTSLTTERKGMVRRYSKASKGVYGRKGRGSQRGK